ncbi:ATP-binding protein [bacterium]|nr:ATP-binding protein [bacterium]
MIGRSEELKHLEALYSSKSFEYLVMYGRRRVGKTTLLQEFSKDKDTVFFSAQIKNDHLNLEDFSKTVQIHFDNMFIAPFQGWKEAFEYINRKVNRRTVVIIDEFPFIADSNPSVKSILQHEIDLSWKNNDNIFLILCGSSVSFMETEVMGSKSPLHDRQTSSIEILPFDYLESSLFFPNFTNEEKLLAYGILGGVPRYLEAFDDNLTIEQNIAEKIIKNGAYLHEEPANLLKAELRETNIYNSILSAIANGRNKVSEIADFIHEDISKVSKYLITLQVIRLIMKKVPCGESADSRKGIYVLTDNFFKFWFRYEFTNNSYYEILGAEKAAEEIMEDIPNLMGSAFGGICTEYLIRLAKKGKLPFVPYSIGRWWGNNPIAKSQDDIDILMLSKKREKGIFVECKFTSKPMPYDEYEDLKTAMSAFGDVKEKYMYFISRSGFTDSVSKAAEKDGARLLTVDDLFRD